MSLYPRQARYGNVQRATLEAILEFLVVRSCRKRKQIDVTLGQS